MPCNDAGRMTPEIQEYWKERIGRPDELAYELPFMQPTRRTVTADEVRTIIREEIREAMREREVVTLTREQARELGVSVEELASVVGVRIR